MIIHVILCECDGMEIVYDVIGVPSVMTYTLVVMSSIERYVDTAVCAICVMTQIQWLWCQKWWVRCQVQSLCCHERSMVIAYILDMMS